MMVQPYIFFDGKCDEALEFYKSALGAKVNVLMRFKDNPSPECNAPGTADKVMHAEFQIGSSAIMASDGYCKGQPKFDGFSLSIACDSDAEVARLFNGLSQGGEVRMPLGPTFFATSFGMVADKFGVGWMLLHAKPM